MAFGNAVKTGASAALRKPIWPARPYLAQSHARVVVPRLAPTAMTVRWQTTAQPEETAQKKSYSDTTKKLVYGMARLMGYYSSSSTAIRASHDLYNTCAEHAEQNMEFFVEACNLPDNFQSWFSVTQLHVWMLMVRLRGEKNGKVYIQEVVNRFFDDAEHRMRKYGIKQQRMINSYIKDLLAQFHGGVVAYDEGMCKDDPVLAAALWRNLFAPTANNAVHLAYVVQYIREELKALDEFDGEKLNAGIVQFSKPKASF
ncbi:ubiquinol-cytochrome C chaperone-domain-containing protein [Fennellomyces sp. T-0311]|nr:ubiquinol-cytochrome C chaperone-domain-containing protein [Fennellomyces sp. T-0311]